MRLGSRVGVAAMALATGIAALLAGSKSAAASPSARLVYARAPEAITCPDETALRHAVSARFGYDPFFAWAKKTIVVQVWRDHVHFAARVQLVDDEGVSHGSREITSDEKGCTELFGAVALAISIALDASIAPPPVVDVPAPSTPPPPPPAPPPVEPPPPPPPPSPPNPRISREAALAALTVEDRDRLLAPALPATPTWRFGIEALGSAGLTIDPALGIAVFGARRMGAISLGVELQADGSPPTTPTTGTLKAPGQIESVLLLAVFAPCLHFGPAFACALGEVGVQADKSLSIALPNTAQTAFGAAGARIGLEVPVSRQFYLRLHVDGLFNLNPVTVNVDGGSAWDEADEAVVAGLGLGTAFL
ncbi:MAG TPA: hypothetical protein VK841_19105 [Polyangiaceae bacterium]|jgi:hypothetical protein|nr:hypothetical protein [Polyangiaceae bacterium]